MYYVSRILVRVPLDYVTARGIDRIIYSNGIDNESQWIDALFGGCLV